MASKEMIEQLKGEMSNELVKAQEQVTIMQNHMTALDMLATDIEAELVAAEAKGYEEGLAKATGTPPTDARYTDAEVNQFLADATAPLNAKIADLELRMSDMQAQVDGLPATIEAAKAEAVAALKADLKAAYEAKQVTETQAETGFGELLN